MQVLVATPEYDGKVTVEYKHSLLWSAHLCWAAGIGILEGDALHYSVIEEGRTEILKGFLASRADSVFWIDSDEGWTPAAFMRLLLSPKDFVAGVSPIKTPTGQEDYRLAVHTHPDGTPIVDRTDGMISVARIGFAFVRIKREAVERMVKHYGTTRLFARIPVAGSDTPFGEDFSFCHRWTSMGGEIWADPNIDFTHTGTYRWRGNYHKFLLRRGEGRE